MQLADWLRLEGISEAEFARRSGVGFRQLIHKYVRGMQFPSPENLVRIRNATGGAVTPNDFLDQHQRLSPNRLSKTPDIATVPPAVPAAEEQTA